MKYVLVHWVESNETSILDEENVKDKSMLKDPKKEGMVMFGNPKMKAPKTGWKSYLAKVLASSDSKKELMKFELDFINKEELEDINSDDNSDNDNKAKRRRLDMPSCENDKPKKNIKKSANAKKAAEREAYAKVYRRIAIDSSESEEDVDKDESDNLPDKITSVPTCSSNLEEEVRKLQRQVLILNNRLPELVKEAVLAALTETKKTPPKLASFPKIQSPSLSQPHPQSARPCSPLSTTSSFSELPSVDKAEQSDSPKLTDYIDSVQINEVMRSPNFKKMTVNLMTALFERKILAESSVTGKSKEGRPALDRTKVELIIALVIKKFPQASDTVIKAAMAQKCKDLRLSMEIRRKKQEN